MATDLMVVGAGGYAREVAQLANLVGVGTTSTTWLVGANEDDDAIRTAALPSYCGVLALGLGRPRERLAAWDKWRQSVPRTWPNLIHPRADVGRSVSIGEGVVAASGVIVTCDVTLADAVALNLNVTVGHDVKIGRGTIINPAATISGAAEIGEGVLVGTGANILEGRKIGDMATIGAGAVVTRDVPAGATYVGVPARAIHG